jgi:hypothetical protein
VILELLNYLRLIGIMIVSVRTDCYSSSSSYLQMPYQMLIRHRTCTQLKHPCYPIVDYHCEPNNRWWSALPRVVYAAKHSLSDCLETDKLVILFAV